MSTLHQCFWLVMGLALTPVISLCQISPEVLADMINPDLQEEPVVEQSAWWEELMDLSKNKINLNNTTIEDLEDLGILSDLQIANIIKYRIELGPYLDVHELQAVPGLDLRSILLIKEFVEIRPEKLDYRSFKSIVQKESKQQLLISWKRTFPKSIAYELREDGSTIYEGDANAFKLKYKYAAGKLLTFGFLAEKDAGETWSKSAFDHYSAYLQFFPKSTFLKKIIIGDYKVNLGQGLISSASAFSGGGGNINGLNSSGKTLQKHSGSAEFGFFRGLGCTLGYKSFDANAFISIKAVDANVLIADSLDQLQGLNRILSLTQTGLHRTPSENLKKNALDKWSAGVTLHFTKHYFKTGLNVKWDKFNFPFQPNEELYKLSFPDEADFLNFSFDYRFRLGSALFSGEFAFDKHSKKANINNLQLSLSEKVDLGFQFRMIPADYYSIDGPGFSSAVNSNNEIGLKLITLFRISTHWKFESYFEYWKHPWLSYSTDAPSNGTNHYFKISYEQRKRMQIYLSLKRKSRQENQTASNAPLNQIKNLNYLQLSLHAGFKVNKSLELRSRLAIHHLIYQESPAFLLFQDLIYKPINFPLSLTTRFAIFESELYETRIYAYENDLLYNFNIPAYSKNGTRFYINLRYKPFGGFSCEFRYARSFYPFEESISSGHDEIENQGKTELKMQLNYSF